ncbi:MAG: hypothetical protein QW356_08555 [Candidatus Hadarchaeales archaeon]
MRYNQRFAMYSLLVPVECLAALMIEASARYFGFTIVPPLMSCLYPFIVLGDPHLWHKIYGKLAKKVGYKASFLVNLDILYWLMIGWIVGGIF